MRTVKQLQKYRAVTLIELLVVVAIIAVLLSILLPALNHSLSVVRDVQCKGNLTRINNAWLMALDERNGRIPTTNSGKSPNWITILDEAFPGAPHLLNAANNSDKNIVSFNACPEIQTSQPPVSYGMFRWGYPINVRWGPAPDSVNEGKSVYRIKNPSAYPFFMDPEVYFRTDQWTTTHKFPRKPKDDYWHAYGVGFYHNRSTTGNAAFADGSAQTITAEQVLQDSEPGGAMPFFQAEH